MTEPTIHELNRNIWKEGKIVSHLCKYAGHIFRHKRLGVKVRVISWDSFTDIVFYKQGDKIRQQFLCDFNDLFEYVGKAKYSDAELDKLSVKTEEEAVKDLADKENYLTTVNIEDMLNLQTQNAQLKELLEWCRDELFEVYSNEVSHPEDVPIIKKLDEVLK